MNRKVSFMQQKYCLLKMEKEALRDGESNPGLPRDRRGYLPLYYHGFADRERAQHLKITMPNMSDDQNN